MQGFHQHFHRHCAQHPCLGWHAASEELPAVLRVLGIFAVIATLAAATPPPLMPVAVAAAPAAGAAAAAAAAHFAAAADAAAAAQSGCDLEQLQSLTQLPLAQPT